MGYDPKAISASPAQPTRSNRAPWLVVLALLVLVGLAQPAAAIVGPDPATADPVFSIIVTSSTDRGDTETLDVTDFARAENWDFGDRESYRCAYVEYIVGGQVLFKIEFERLEVAGQDTHYVVIHDRGGIESGENGFPPSPGDLCGMPAGGGPRQFDDSPFVPGGANFTVYQNEAPLATYSLPSAAPANPEALWSVGDEPGEAYMWYVAPGEANDPIVRFSIVPMAPGVSLTPTPPPSDHATEVTLHLRGRLRAEGNVRVPDGMLACRANRLVIVERRGAGVWAGAGRATTTATGSYSIRLRDRQGTYRARILETTLSTGDTCAGATSGPRSWRGRPR